MYASFWHTKMEASKIINEVFFCIVLFFLIYPVFLTKEHGLARSLPPNISAPIIEHAIFILKVLLFASLEEFLYRAYFPNALKERLSYAFKRVEKSTLTIVSKGLSHILFAWAHLYLGAFNAIFAFFSAMFFMYLYDRIKTWNSYFAFFLICALHASFNIASFYMVINAT